MAKQPVRPTRSMRNDDFAKHINARHLMGDGEVFPTHFDFIYGLETIWRGWHRDDHKNYPNELDHYHTNPEPPR